MKIISLAKSHKTFAVAPVSGVDILSLFGIVPVGKTPEEKFKNFEAQTNDVMKTLGKDNFFSMAAMAYLTLSTTPRIFIGPVKDCPAGQVALAGLPKDDICQLMQEMQHAVEFLATIDVQKIISGESPEIH